MQPLQDVLDVVSEQVLILVIDFSGMACVEMAVEFMRVQLRRYGVVEPNTNF